MAGVFWLLISGIVSLNAAMIAAPLVAAFFAFAWLTKY